MPETLRPLVSGLIGGAIAVALLLWASNRRARREEGRLILEFPWVLKAILLLGAVGFPPLAVFALTHFRAEFASGGTDLWKFVGGVLIVAVNLALAVAAPYAAWRATLETIAFDDEGFTQSRLFPRWSRRVLWSDILRAGYNPFLQYFWLEPREGPKFRYSDGMSGLSEFQARVCDALKFRGGV